MTNSSVLPWPPLWHLSGGLQTLNKLHEEPSPKPGTCCSSASSSSFPMERLPCAPHDSGAQSTCVHHPQVAPFPKTSVWLEEEHRGGCPRGGYISLETLSQFRHQEGPGQAGALRAIFIPGFHFWILLPNNNNNKSQVHPQYPTGNVLFLKQNGGFRCSFYYAL